MKLFGIEIRKASKKEIAGTYTMRGGTTPFGSRSKPMLLSTVYRCVDVIGDAVAQLPLDTYLVDKDGFKTRTVLTSTTT